MGKNETSIFKGGVLLRSPSAGMFYVFCDEKHFQQQCAISTGVVLVPQQSWSYLDPQLQGLQEPKRTQRIGRLRHVLERVDGIGLVAWTQTIDIAQAGCRDSTIDIKDMARADNIWGIAMATGVYRTLISARTIELEVKTADIHYDTFDLRSDHRKALYAALRERIPKDIRDARMNGYAPPDFRPRIRRIEDTPKASRGENPTKFQIGVEMAHVLLQHTIQLQSNVSLDRIFFVDNTGIISDFIKRF